MKATVLLVLFVASQWRHTESFLLDYINSQSLSQPVCQACPGKKPFSTTPVNADQLVALSPIIVYSMSSEAVSNQLTSAVCYTYQKLYPGIYLVMYTNTLFDGTVVVNFYFKKDGPQGPGTLWFTGLFGQYPFMPSLSVGYAMKQFCCKACNSTLFAAYLESEAVGCPSTPAPNPILVYGNIVSPDDGCLLEAENHLKKYFGNISFTRISNKFPVNCVGDFYGARVINYDLLSRNKDVKVISYPLQE